MFVLYVCKFCGGNRIRAAHLKKGLVATDVVKNVFQGSKIKKKKRKKFASITQLLFFSSRQKDLFLTSSFRLIGWPWSIVDILSFLKIGESRVLLSHIFKKFKKINLEVKCKMKKKIAICLFFIKWKCDRTKKKLYYFFTFLISTLDYRVQL